MSKNKSYVWLKSNKTIGGYKCIRPRPGMPDDLSVYGKHGYISSCGDSYIAVIDNPIVANTTCKKIGMKGGYKKGDECKICFDETQLLEMLKTIRAYRQWDKQIRKAHQMANRPYP